MDSLLGYICVMAVTTYLIRCTPLLFFRKRIKNRYVQSFLYYVPYAVLGSIDFSCYFYRDRQHRFFMCGMRSGSGVGLSRKKSVDSGTSSFDCRVSDDRYSWLIKTRASIGCFFYTFS